MIYKTILRAAGKEDRCLVYDEDGRLHVYVTAEDAEPVLAALNAAYGNVFFLGELSSTHARTVSEDPATDKKRPHPNDAYDDRLRKRLPDSYKGGLIPADWDIDPIADEEEEAPTILDDEEEEVPLDEEEEEITDAMLEDIDEEEEEGVVDAQAESKNNAKASAARTRLLAKFRRGIPTA